MLSPLSGRPFLVTGDPAEARRTLKFGSSLRIVQIGSPNDSLNSEIFHEQTDQLCSECLSWLKPPISLP